jgi:glyoxylase-like metal-dependent hydrolase (beta-lactamase superfamily II)
LIESGSRLVLVDTGLGLLDLQNPKRLGLIAPLLNVQVDRSLSAYDHVKKLGYSPSDVTDLVLTHLDLDHAGGIPDFKHATVHVSELELAAAKSRKTFRFRERYRTHHVEGDVKWKTFKTNTGERWRGFEQVQSLEGLPPEILVVPLAGHTPGHCGVAVKKDAGWVLHAGDAYYDERDLAGGKRGPLWSRAFARAVHTDHSQAMRVKASLAELRQASDVKVFCSHDAKELKEFL